MDSNTMSDHLDRRVFPKISEMLTTWFHKLPILNFIISYLIEMSLFVNLFAVFLVKSFWLVKMVFKIQNWELVKPCGEQLKNESHIWLNIDVQSFI